MKPRTDIKPRKLRIPSEMGKCPSCGQMELSQFVCSDTLEFRGLLLDVENLQKSRCLNCKAIFETQAQTVDNQAILRTAYSQKREFLRKEEGLLTACEIEKIRKDFSLSQREAAALFGGGYNAFNKYESGEVLQSVPMDRLLRLSRAVGHAAIEILQNINNPPRAYVFFETSYAKYDIQKTLPVSNPITNFSDVITMRDSSLLKAGSDSDLVIEFGY